MGNYALRNRVRLCSQWQGHFTLVSDMKVNNTDWEKFKIFFKLVLYRSIFQCQAQKRAHGSTALKSLEQVGQSFNSNCQQNWGGGRRKTLSGFFRSLDNTSQTFSDCSTYNSVGRDSSVDIATRYEMDGPGIESRAGYIFSANSISVLGHTQLPIKLCSRSFTGVKRTVWR